MVDGLFVWNLIMWTSLWGMVFIVYRVLLKRENETKEELARKKYLLVIAGVIGARVAIVINRYLKNQVAPQGHKFFAYTTVLLYLARKRSRDKFIGLLDFVEGRGIIRRERAISTYLKHLKEITEKSNGSRRGRQIL